jgi:UDP-glucuronate 4-epimerase
MESNNKTILVTGGAGFIGSQAVKFFLDRGDEVVAVDNFNDYYDPALKKSRQENLLSGFQKFKMYKADITDYSAMEEIFKKHEFSHVLHLAAQAGVRYSLSNPFAYEKTNILGTLNMLELCRQHNVKNFIFASSSSIYGDNKKIPFSEDDKAENPISIYAATKKSNEEMAYSYHHLFGLNCTGIRFFTVYGPWGRPDMALFMFTKNILAGESIDVYNNGEMYRDFTYVDDIISGVVAAVDKSYAYEIINLAGGKTIKLLDYISEIEKNLNKKAIMNFMPMQPGDVPATTADISKAEKMLGYSPQFSVQIGVKNFIDWYLDYYKIIL